MSARSTGFVIEVPAVPSIPVEGTDQLFPVRRVYCVGRNYADHAIEMGHDPNREPPFFFQKNPDALITTGEFPYPVKSNDVHHEIELIVALGKGGSNISPDRALDHVYGYAVGLDMTRRDLQAEAKKMGRPWEIAKSFEDSAPTSVLVPASEIGHPSKGAIWLDVNGTRRQTGDLAQMIWNVPDTIAYLSEFFTLAPGDVIMTGTPAGVGAVERGDEISGGVEGVGTIEVRVV
ncbi:fumarylacetoacetate hydrolase family protein [Microvirga sp. 2MCAF38]|uniref:fumarylacetoacetate hydrolase family protein n=1 Tax=Microvirga sp. 2MCAF38 TaxID=3232989 RepID=UPI003F984F3F